MKCPSCHHEFRLTLRKYFRSLAGRHDCPACRTRFRLKFTLSYLFILIGAEIVLALIPASIVHHFSQSTLTSEMVLIVCSVIFVLPIDIWLDDKWRESIRIK